MSRLGVISVGHSGRLTFPIDHPFQVAFKIGWMDDTIFDSIIGRTGASFDPINRVWIIPNCAADG